MKLSCFYKYRLVDVMDFIVIYRKKQLKFCNEFMYVLKKRDGIIKENSNNLVEIKISLLRNL